MNEFILLRFPVRFGIVLNATFSHINWHQQRSLCTHGDVS